MSTGREPRSWPRRLLPLLVPIAVSVVVGAFVGTRVLVDAFGLQASLGAPVVGNWYSPLEGWRWTRVAFESNRTEVFRAWAFGAVAVPATFVAWLGAHRLLTRGRPTTSESHGSARWARRDDIVTAGLLDTPTTGQSLIVGGWLAPGRRRSATPEYLTHSGPEGVAVYAPSRSGKTVGLVVPNLLCYESSAFVLDVKGELWTQTAGYRRDGLGQRVLFHDPGSSDPGNARFNPLEEVDIAAPSAIRDVQMLLDYLIPIAEKKDASVHFDNAARSLAVGIFLYEIARAWLAGDAPASIASVLSAITRPGRDIREYLEDELAVFEPDGLDALAQVVRESATEQLGREEREFTAVLSSLVTPLSRFRDPILAAATARSDFRLLDLVEHADAVTLYLTIRPVDRDRLSHYFGLIVNLVCRQLTARLASAGEARREVLLLLEEFTSLPALPVVQKSMDVMPGYGVKPFIVLQDYESLQGLYGAHETFSSNVRVQIAYTPSKPKTAAFLSEMVGTTTARQTTESQQRKLLSPLAGSETAGEGYHTRALMTPDEVLRLGVARVDARYRLVEPGESLVFVRGCPAIRAVMTPWFLDPELVGRAACPAPEGSDRLRVESGDRGARSASGSGRGTPEVVAHG